MFFGVHAKSMCWFKSALEHQFLRFPNSSVPAQSSFSFYPMSAVNPVTIAQSDPVTVVLLFNLQ
jgi:hypothetical protein